MGVFCLPLSSCYTMVDIFLNGLPVDQSANPVNSTPTPIPGNSICGDNYFGGNNTLSIVSGICGTGKGNLITESPGLTFDLLGGEEVVSAAPPIYLFDNDSAYWFQVVWICLLHNLLIVVGLVGNILNLIILSRHGIGSNTTNVLLLSLAAIDCVLLLSNGVQNMTCFTCHLAPATATTVDTATNIYLTSPSRWISFVNLDITALIAIERAISVFAPFRAPRLFTIKTIRVAFAIITVIVVVVLVPHMVGVRPYWQFDPAFNQTVAVTFTFIGNFNNFLIFWSFLENLNAIGCVSIIFFCGSATAIKLIQQSRNRETMTVNPGAGNRLERRAIIMLLIICFISFVVHLPNSANQLYSSLFLDQLAKDGMYCALRAFGSFLGTVNASVNFFIYFFMSSKFKETYRNLFRKTKSSNGG